MLKNYNENNEQMIGSILFKENKEKIKQMIETMWNYRTGKMIENYEEQSNKERKQ